MAETVKITIPAAVAAFVRPGVSAAERLRAVGGACELPVRDRILLLFCLGKDCDPEVSNTARVTFAALPEQALLELAGWQDIHPAILHVVAQLHGHLVSVREMLLCHPNLADSTRTVLESLDNALESVACEHTPDIPDAEELSDAADEGDEAEVDEQGEEYLSKYQVAQTLGIGEKIKMALTGDKEWRKILVKDANKLVSGSVMKNPRITEPEVLYILKCGVQNDEIVRLICANREWVKNYQIRKALVENPKTPLANALRFLGTLGEKDVAGYAKSRNISSVISTQAKRIMLNKQKR